jgi:hypothetical protein
MRYLATPEFADKVRALATRPQVAAHVNRALAAIQASDRATLMAPGGPLNLRAEMNGIWAMKAGPVRVFLSFGDDGQGEYALLVDLAELHHEARTPAPVPLFKDPSRNPALNPKTNPSINPNTNASLNPRFNASINPRFNASLNPRFNASINPRYNASINPRYNASLNPKYNAQLNPRYNATLNPRYNPSYAGPFLFDLSDQREGFFIHASDGMLLQFANDGTFSGYAVPVGSGPFALFDTNAEWKGYLVPTGQGGYLRFDPGAQWTGYVV